MEFGIQLNLGLIYEGLKMFDDAKQMYMEILQKENYYTPGIMFQKVRVNIGNIYYNQGEYRKAITEWQKAVDKISKDNKEMRGMILRNIANAHIKSGNYTDAIDNYNESVKYKEDMKTYMNLLLSNIAFNKIDQTKIAFNRMLESSINIEKEIDATEEKKSTMDALREYLVIRNSIIKNKSWKKLPKGIALFLIYDIIYSSNTFFIVQFFFKDFISLNFYFIF